MHSSGFTTVFVPNRAPAVNLPGAPPVRYERGMSEPSRIFVPSRRSLLRLGLSAGAGAVVAPLVRGEAAEAAASAAPTPGRLAPVEYPLRLTHGERAPDGRTQPVLLTNHALPAPEIRFRAGFLLRTAIANGLEEATAIHWHGPRVPNAMDGEIGVTQLAIGPGAVTTYEFPAAEPGTFWYRSTAGLQRQLGLAGPLVVTEREDPDGATADHAVFLSDWASDPQAVLDGLRARGGVPEAEERERFVNPGPDGRPFPTDVRFSTFLLNGHAFRNAWTCRAGTGTRVRLRLVNGSAQTFFRVMVAGHRLEVVAADGRPVEPVVVDHLVLGTGERYDVIVTVREPGSYAIRAAALGQSGGAIGVLHTPEAKPSVSTAPPGWSGEGLRYDMLRARRGADLPAGAWRNLRVSLAEDEAAYRFSVNGESYPADPGHGEIPGALSIQPGERVAMEIDNKTRFAQAVHLHGHVFRVLSDGVPPEVAPRKDTLWVEPGRQARIQLAADNPGRWLLEGMGLYRRLAGLARVVAYVSGSATR